MIILEAALAVAVGIVGFKLVLDILNYISLVHLTCQEALVTSPTSSNWKARPTMMRRADCLRRQLRSI